jgi:hypothetical protein
VKPLAILRLFLLFSNVLRVSFVPWFGVKEPAIRGCACLNMHFCAIIKLHSSIFFLKKTAAWTPATQHRISRTSRGAISGSSRLGWTLILAH